MLAWRSQRRWCVQTTITLPNTRKYEYGCVFPTSSKRFSIPSHQSTLTLVVYHKERTNKRIRNLFHCADNAGMFVQQLLYSVSWIIQNTNKLTSHIVTHHKGRPKKPIETYSVLASRAKPTMRVCSYRNRFRQLLGCRFLI